jgi:hypothetical protein
VSSVTWSRVNKLVGSALLLSGIPADVDAVAVEPVRAISWEVGTLERYLDAHPETRIIMQQHLARDLAGKMDLLSRVLPQLPTQTRKTNLNACLSLVNHRSAGRAARILNNCDKDTMFKVSETNAIIPPKAATLNNNLTQNAKATGDERVKQLTAAFAEVAVERARVFGTPFPELAEVAEAKGIKLDFDLNGRIAEGGRRTALL